MKSEFKKDTGYIMLKRTSDHNFEKWGEWMKRAQLAERKVELLKRLVLLVHPSVSNVEMNTTSLTQWSEFIKEFPDEK